MRSGIASRAAVLAAVVATSLPARAGAASSAAQEDGAVESAGVPDVAPGLLEVLRDRVREHLPEVLLQRAFVLENWQWLALGLLILLAVTLDRVARAVLGGVVRRRAGKQHVSVATELVAGFARPVGLFVGAIAFGTLLPIVGLEGRAQVVLAHAADLVATVAGVWAAYRLVDLFAGALESKASQTDTKVDDILVPLVRRTLKIFVIAVGGVYLATRFTDDLWGLVAGLSIGTLAVGFAARDSIENLFGTFTVLVDKPFTLGDWIVVDGVEGTVEEIGFRSTRIRTFYASLLSVPNRRFISADVDNMGRRPRRRFKSMLSLTYDTPPPKVEAFCEGVSELIRRHPATWKDSFHVRLNAFAASSVDVLLYVFFEVSDWSHELRARHDLMLDILRLAERLGVSFAFPTTTVHLHREEGGDGVVPAPPDGIDGAQAAGRKAARSVVSGRGAAPEEAASEAGGDGGGDDGGDDGD